MIYFNLSMRMISIEKLKAEEGKRKLIIHKIYLLIEQRKQKIEK